MKTRRPFYRHPIVLAVGGLIALLLCIQLVPVWAAQTNPPVVAEPKWDSPQTRALAQRACFDCHSNETVWPWYSRVAPVSWLVTWDTIRGRNRLNFSEWGVAGRSREGGEGGGGREGGDEFSKVIQNGQMPPSNYLILHPNGALSDAEKQQLIQGLEASVRSSP